MNQGLRNNLQKFEKCVEQHKSPKRCAYEGGSQQYQDKVHTGLLCGIKYIRRCP